MGQVTDMKSQYNNISKPFNRELYNTTKVKSKWINDIFHVIKVVPQPIEDYGIDSYWLTTSNGGTDRIVAGIEWEKATSKSWRYGNFPYNTASFLTRKDKYANLAFKTFFIRLNSEENNAYVIPIEPQTLQKQFIHDIARSGNSIAIEGEQRYLIPTELIVFGFDYIEPFIVAHYLQQNSMSKEDKNKKFSELVKGRAKRGCHVPSDFISMCKRRRKLLETKYVQ